MSITIFFFKNNLLYLFRNFEFIIWCNTLLLLYYCYSCIINVYVLNVFNRRDFEEWRAEIIFHILLTSSLKSRNRATLSRNKYQSFKDIELNNSGILVFRVFRMTPVFSACTISAGQKSKNTRWWRPKEVSEFEMWQICNI